ncbi:hypothetical protein BGZ83_005430 [Gryganskiella cystojenkinii]|nr:hypothetical protein BGZ83_005430 [Gryganskiella cystojenkinii]
MVPSASSSSQICTRLILRRTITTTARPPLSLSLSRHHYATFSFFSHNSDPANSSSAIPPPPSSSSEQLDDSKARKRSHPSHSNNSSLRTSPSYDQAAPLLSAIQNKDQDTAWMIYSVQSRAGQLSSLLPIHHSLLLKSIRPTDPHRFTTQEIQKLTERFEQVWAGMLSCQIQPDMNNYTTRLEFFVATRQYTIVDQTWREISAEMTGSRASSGAPLLPTLFTYNLILKSCVPRKNIDLAMATIHAMKRAGIHPDTSSWDYVLQVHTAMKNWSAVESTFRSAFITAQDTEASGSTNTLNLQRLYRQQGSTSELMAIPLGQKPRTLHGGALNSGNYVKDGSSGNKLYPSIQNIHTLFAYYAYTQDIDTLRSMFESHVRLLGVVPTTRTYNEMIKFAFLSRRDGDAVDLFKELVQIGQNVEMAHQNKKDFITASATNTTVDNSAPQTPGFGPDFNTFQIMINNELIGMRARWGRAWRWMQIMQESYGLVPSEKMFVRTLTAMRRRGADDSTIQALEANWRAVRERRGGDSYGGLDPQDQQDQQDQNDRQDEQDKQTVNRPLN